MRSLRAVFILTSIFYLLSSTAFGQVTPITPQSIRRTIFTNKACSAGSVIVPDIGQNSHFLLYRTTGTINTISFEIDGSADGTNYYVISNVATDTTAGAIFTSIWLPFIRINMTACTGTGTVFADYTGTSAVSPNPGGAFAISSDLPFKCTKTQAFSFTGTGKVVTNGAVVGTRIRICHLSFSLSASDTVTIKEGSGVNCGTGTVTRGGPYPAIVTAAFDYEWWGALTTLTALKDVCLTVTGAATIGGLADYAEF